jgi:putative ABC transport system substrate-binding protein
MRRREVFAVLGVAAATWPMVARAQSQPVVGLLSSGSSKAFAPNVAAVLQGLKDGGFVDGKNMTIEHRSADGQFDRLPVLAAELVRKPVDVLVTLGGNVSAVAAKSATSTIPIVFVTADDPVVTGLVASLNRPGSNLTGVARLGTQLGAKNLELLHEVLPAVSVIGLLVNPKRPTYEAQIKNVRDAASTIGKTIRILPASDEREINEAFKIVASEKIGGLLVPFDPVFNIHRSQIIALASRHAVPAAYSLREFVTSGGLMSYGDDLVESYSLSGDLAARILKGAKPIDLPVRQAVKVELALNLKTAKALGLKISLPLLGRADEVIE